MPRKKTEYLIVHCSATRPSQDITIRTIDKWHRNRGFLKVGYHAVITQSGEIQKGRELEETGAHCKQKNHNSIGVCLIGGVTENDIKIPEANFTDAQWSSLKKYVTTIQGIYQDIKIIGHNEVSSKACPSFNVQEWLVKEGFKKPPRITTEKEKELLEKTREKYREEDRAKYRKNE